MLVTWNGKFVLKSESDISAINSLELNFLLVVLLLDNLLSIAPNCLPLPVRHLLLVSYITSVE